MRSRVLGEDMSQVMDHVRELADVIGPRPACTDAEARAADYIEGIFRARGLESERQEFDCPRTSSWAQLVYHVLTLGAAVLSLWFGWPAAAVALVAAILLWLDLDMRFSLAPFLGKGPSQNIIARHVPRQRRGERLKRVVIVAHYDSAKPSLTSSPGMVRNQPLLQKITLVTTFLTPLVIAVGAMPFAVEWKPWTGYAALASAAFLLFPVFVLLHKELIARATDGANDNASGIAAMLGVMEATVPEPEEAQLRDRPHYRDAGAAYEAGVVPEDAVLEYRPVGAEETSPRTREGMPLDGFGDVDWETGAFAPVAQQAAPGVSAPAATPAPAAAPSGDWSEDAGIGTLWEDEEPESPKPADLWPARPQPARPKPSPVPVNWGQKPAAPLEEDDRHEGQESLPFDLPEARPAAAPQAAEKEHEHHSHGISAWLGIGKGFDVRKAGKKIGSWENLDHDDEDDEFGYKGGTAGDAPGTDEGFASDIAARIRRRVTESVDRALSEKEIWFVATGADEAGFWGIRNLLQTYGDELEDALIININAVGTGTVAFVSEEGIARRYHADRRLVAQSRRTVRENDLAVKSRSFRGYATSAAP
ncbi:hypothetical protein EG835_01705, partial [bacterium]|nr:hypothetical protein [bacterium]